MKKLLTLLILSWLITLAQAENVHCKFNYKNDTDDLIVLDNTLYFDGKISQQQITIQPKSTSTHEFTLPLSQNTHNLGLMSNISQAQYPAEDGPRFGFKKRPLTATEINTLCEKQASLATTFTADKQHQLLHIQANESLEPKTSGRFGLLLAAVALGISNLIYGVQLLAAAA